MDIDTSLSTERRLWIAITLFAPVIFILSGVDDSVNIIPSIISIWLLLSLVMLGGLDYIVRCEGFMKGTPLAIVWVLTLLSYIAFELPFACNGFECFSWLLWFYGFGLMGISITLYKLLKVRGAIEAKVTKRGIALLRIIGLTIITTVVLFVFFVD